MKQGNMKKFEYRLDASRVQVAEAGHRPPHHQGPAHDEHQAAFLMIS